MVTLKVLVHAVLAILLSGLASFGVHAMQWSVQPQHIFASGTLDDGDPVQLRAALAVNPNVKSLVLVNVSGSDFASALRLADIIGQQGMDTRVVGYCIGACAPAFVAGAQRGFAVGEHPRRTFVGIQAAFDANGRVDNELTARWVALLKRRIGGAYDDAIMRTAMEQSLDPGGMLRAREVTRTAAPDRPAFFCESGQSQMSDCRILSKDALALGLITQAALAEVPLPVDVRPKPEFFGRTLSATAAENSAERLRSQGTAMCAANASCLQRWEAALPVFQRQKIHRAAALGDGIPGLGFSDDQESFDLAAKRAVYLCNHAANNKKLCRVAAINEFDVADQYTESAEATRRGRDQLRAMAPMASGGSGAEAAPADGPPVALRARNLFALTPSVVPGIKVWATADLAVAVRDARVVLIDVLGPIEQMLPGAVHFWDGGLAFAEPAADDAYARRFADMLKVAAPSLDAELVFYCRDAACWHAVNAALRARKLGYTKVGWYRGGLQAWAEAKLPLVRKVPAAVIH